MQLPITISDQVLLVRGIYRHVYPGPRYGHIVKELPRWVCISCVSLSICFDNNYIFSPAPSPGRQPRAKLVPPRLHYNHHQLTKWMWYRGGGGCVCGGKRSLGHVNVMQLAGMVERRRH